jgi:hypothetical protein
MQPEKGNYCLATYRGQEANNRVEIRMRVVEGHYGTVQVGALTLPRLGFRVPAAPVERSIAFPPHRPREGGLAHPADTSRSNLA